MNLENKQLVTKELILQAAKREFAERGYEGARMSSIAQRAGVNQALLHYYFTSKENLYVSVLQELFWVNQESILDELDRYELSASQRLYVVIYYMVYTALEEPDSDFNRIMAIELSSGHKNIRNIVEEFFVPRMKQIEQIIIDGVNTGEFQTPDPLMVVILIVVFVIEFGHMKEFADLPFMMRLFDGDYKNRALHFMVEFIFKGLRSEGIHPVSIELPQEAMQNLKSSIDSTIQQRRGGTHA